MSWSRGSLLAALLALPASIALADTVVVDTTADDTNAATCSLRDAVAYLNIPADERPASHSNGCGREGDASEQDVIKLPYSSAPYVISSSKGVIDIDSSISISGQPSATDVPKNPFIWLQGSSAFKIDGPALPSGLGSQSAALALAASSDSGVSDSDRHTTDRVPVFTGSGVSPSGLMCVYAKEESEPETEYQLVASTTSDVAGAWSKKSDMTLPEGIVDVALIAEADAECGAFVAADAYASLKISIYSRSAVSVSKMDFVGCGANLPKLPAHIRTSGVVPATCMVGNGGVFFVNEYLDLDKVVVRGGTAANGGIVYVGREGALVASSSSFLQGRAAMGEAIYVARGGSLLLSEAVVAENTGGSEAIRFAAAVGAEAGLGSVIQNATIHGNDGYGILLQDKIIVNGVTLLGNAAGSISFAVTDLSGEDDQVFILNSIVSGACSAAASWPADTTKQPRFNLVDSSCGLPVGQNTINNSFLVASPAADKSCFGSAAGILCPQDVDGDTVYDFYSPRFLPGLDPDGDPTKNFSPLINKGATGDHGAACPSRDQRGQERSEAGRCDIGAIEFRYVGGGLRTGDVLVAGRYQHLFHDDIREESDEELYLPPDVSLCPVVMPTAPLAGAAANCPWLSKVPSKGVVRLTHDRRGFIYESSSNYHGFDTFRIQVATTASRLNDPAQPTSRFRSLDVTATNEPVSGIESDDVIDGGATDWLLLVIGAILLHMRRNRFGVVQG
jgi:hypothetical protein